jgi:hypothetical protein
MSQAVPADRPQPTSLPAVLAVTLLVSLGSGVFWHGLSFIAKHTYDFSLPRNLALYTVMGAIYMVGAFNAGRFARLASCCMGPRMILGWALALQAALCALPMITPHEWALWATAGAVSLLSSLIWPIIESYLTAGRHGPVMRSAIAWFNVAWMSAMAVPLFAMAPLLKDHGEWAIGGLAIAGVLAMLSLGMFGRSPGTHDAEIAAGHVADAYPHLLRCARVLLPMSYVLSSGLAPILPYRFGQIGVPLIWETPSTATWMIMRVVALVVMWKLPFWHGRWGTLLLGALTMSIGFAGVVLAGNLALMLLGFASMGIGLGVVYYAALYYAMAVGRAEVDAGATHEGLIGAGYTVGPLAGLAGNAIGGGVAIVGVMWAVVGAAAVGAIRPYVKLKAESRKPRAEG